MTILEMKQHISTKISTSEHILHVNRILIIKNEESNTEILNYMEDSKKASDYNIDNGSMLNIYKWTGSLALENGQPVTMPENVAVELQALNIEAEGATEVEQQHDS
jgi:uncharacterized secreted protein with C-terminal beta-propeller domain